MMKMLFIVLLFFVVLIDARPQDTVSSPGHLVENTQNLTFRTENEDGKSYRTTRNPSLRESVKMVASQLINNNTAADFTLDTRTPPKIRLQHKLLEKKKQEAAEASHPGIAVPIDIDSFFMETSTQKRSVFYRNEYKPPTTDSGISTWILLSGQSTTPKPNRKQTTIKTTSPPSINKTVTTTEKSIKPTIKLKPITTQKPKSTTTAPTTIRPLPTTKTSDKTQTNKILSKIKASILSNAANAKNKTSPRTTMSPETTTQLTTVVTTKKNNEESNKITIANTESNELPLEAKIVDIDLPDDKSVSTTKRPRRPTPPNKRKKNNNKNRRRKPSATNNEKNNSTNNNTRIAQKEKPFGTQIYNYLSREVMPTVGVGLVGLMVTAGLASYFLYPFGGLRRAYDSATDRKDYYYDDYSPGGVAEEELIGKVLAGMPENSEYSNSYRSPLARKEAYRTDTNYKQRNTDTYFQYPTDYKTVAVGSKVGYRHDVIAEQQKETGYTVDDREFQKKQFVVGNVPKELEHPVTPITVPEHGPRNLRIRRQTKQFDQENEVINYNDKNQSDDMNNDNYNKITESDVDKEPTAEVTETTEPPIYSPEPVKRNFFTFLRNLLELKFRVGLDFLLRTTDNFSKYLRGVQERVNHVLREQKSATPRH